MSTHTKEIKYYFSKSPVENDEMATLLKSFFKSNSIDYERTEKWYCKINDDLLLITQDADFFTGFSFSVTGMRSAVNSFSELFENSSELKKMEDISST